MTDYLAWSPKEAEGQWERAALIELPLFVRTPTANAVPLASSAGGLAVGWAPAGLPLAPLLTVTIATILLRGVVLNALTLERFAAACFVDTTNNASNYWTLELRVFDPAAVVVTMLSTVSIGANAWSKRSTTTFTAQSVASTATHIDVLATPIGAPGALNVTVGVLAR